MGLPSVGIVIVTWNKNEDVLNLLTSLKTINYENYEIFVVDNASTDDTVEKIKKTFPKVNLIENEENLGGTGGFNTGMKYVLDNREHDIIWLLDNDAEVESDTLIELVKVAQQDEEVGIVGSLIMEPDKDMIVELGAFVLWPIGTWKPNLRGKLLSNYNELDTIEVDYVAACSLIVKREVLKDIGLMDSRYFLHWDDIDFSLRAKEQGYKIKAAPKSRVYHGVEDKRINPIVSYYDIRNGLLTITKHHSGINKLIYILNMMRGTCKSAVYSILVGLGNFARVLFQAPIDFVRGNFYKLNMVVNIYNPFISKKTKFSISELSLNKNFRIIIFPNGSFKSIKSTLENIRKIEPNCKIDLLVQEDRKELFDQMNFDNIVTFEPYKQSTLNTIQILLRLLFNRYSICISPGLSILPFSYSATKYFLHDKNGGFYRCNEDIRRIWKLPISFLTGELIACLFLPFVYIASLKYK